jgi:hypothetical protein
MSFANQERPSHIQHACANRWHVSNESWRLRASNRPITRAYIPPVSLLNGGLLEFYFAGELFGAYTGDTQQLVFNFGTVGDPGASGWNAPDAAWTAAQFWSPGFGISEGSGKFTVKATLMGMGRYQTFAKAELWLGSGSTSAVSGHYFTQAFIDPVAASGATVVTVGRPSVDDSISIGDGHSTSVFKWVVTPSVSGDIELGATELDAIKSLKSAILDSGMYLRPVLTGGGSPYTLTIDRFKGGTEYIGTTPAVAAVVGISNYTVTDFTTTAADTYSGGSDAVDWEAGTDIFVTARRGTSNNGNGGFIGSFGVFQRGVTRGWEPRT